MSQQPKIGQGSLQAFVRQGAKELAQALQATPESIRPVEEPGTVFNPTPHEVSKQTGAISERSGEKFSDMNFTPGVQADRGPAVSPAEPSNTYQWQQEANHDLEWEP
ncbi:MAG: hypothetical protein MPJ50_19360 [Pirellulales bacterium]|nr:hypothetical protein [Pirellulales bacterium]